MNESDYSLILCVLFYLNVCSSTKAYDVHHPSISAGTECEFECLVDWYVEHWVIDRDREVDPDICLGKQFQLCKYCVIVLLV